MVPRVARIFPTEAFAHQLRQQAAVVDMRMGQQNDVDIGGAEWKCAVVQCLQRLGALKQTAVDQQAPGRGLEQIAGAGHGAGRAAKSDGHAHDVASPPASAADFTAQRRRQGGIERNRVGGMRHAVRRADRCGCQRSINRVAQFRGKQRMGDDRIDRRRARGNQDLGASDERAARRNDIVDQQNRAAFDRLRIGQRDLDRTVAVTGLLRHRVGNAEPARKVAHPRLETPHPGRQ